MSMEPVTIINMSQIICETYLPVWKEIAHHVTELLQLITMIYFF